MTDSTATTSPLLLQRRRVGGDFDEGKKIANRQAAHSRDKRFHLTEYEQDRLLPQTAFIVQGTHCVFTAHSSSITYENSAYV